MLYFFLRLCRGRSTVPSPGQGQSGRVKNVVLYLSDPRYELQYHPDPLSPYTWLIF